MTSTATNKKMSSRRAVKTTNSRPQNAVWAYKITNVLLLAYAIQYIDAYVPTSLSYSQVSPHAFHQPSANHRYQQLHSTRRKGSPFADQYRYSKRTKRALSANTDVSEEQSRRRMSQQYPTSTYSGGDGNNQQPETIDPFDTENVSNEELKERARRWTTTSERRRLERKQQKTLYEVLGASPDSTRAELKQKYVRLARISHPDAVRSSRSPVSNNNSANATDTSIASAGLNDSTLSTVDFTEIAAAWRILSDPKQRKRYDRTLQAERISDDIASWASNLTVDMVIPAAADSIKAISDLAMPFLRRTTATTLASIQAVAADWASGSDANWAEGQKKQEKQRPQMKLQSQQELQQPTVQPPSAQRDGANAASTGTPEPPVSNLATRDNNRNKASQGFDSRPSSNPFDPLLGGGLENDFSRTFRAAIDAARRAGREVDRRELLSKAAILEDRAVSEYRNALELQKQLQILGKERLRLSLHTSNSRLTATEAEILLDQFNLTIPADRVSVWDRALMRSSVESEISELRRAEETFIETQKMDSQAQEIYRNGVRERLLARTALLRAEKEEELARLAYEEATREVQNRKAALEGVTRDLAQAETVAKKTSYEIERKSVIIGKLSERVRSALQRSISKERGKSGASTNFDNYDYQYTSAEVMETRLLQLQSVRDQERGLAENYAKMEVNAARLLSRANKLKVRAEELEKMD